MTLSWFYYIDGIYPRHRIFINSYSKPRSHKENAFSRQQEGVRKNVERVVAVLSGRFQILARPFRLWGKEDIGNIVHSCAALHNAMMEFRKSNGENNGTKCMEIVPEAVCLTTILELHVPRTEIEKKSRAHITADLTENNEHHFQLKNALMEHVWKYAKNGIRIAIVTNSDNYK
jgi:deoxycytidylate deaminase